MIPDGTLCRSRVVTDLGAELDAIRRRRLDGYIVVAPQRTLLGGDGDRSIITFEDGIARLAYHPESDRGGPAALGRLGPGPYRVDRYELDAADLDIPHETTSLQVPPGGVAERLADDPAVADRIREAAAEQAAGDDSDPVAAFLENEAAIDDIRETARAEAHERAAEWGLEDALED